MWLRHCFQTSPSFPYALQRSLGVFKLKWGQQCFQSARFQANQNLGVAWWAGVNIAAVMCFKTKNIIVWLKLGITGVECIWTKAGAVDSSGWDDGSGAKEVVHLPWESGGDRYLGLLDMAGDSQPEQRQFYQLFRFGLSLNLWLHLQNSWDSVVQRNNLSFYSHSPVDLINRSR